jgi:hypothetical protein
MKTINFEKGVCEKLASNLPCASVIVLDNALFHSIQSDRVLLKYSMKKDIIK